MDKRRKINISARIAEQARQDKNHLDALAFACLIRINFGNSHCKYRKFSELKAFFHMGQDKLKRVIKNAREYGYIVEDGKGGYFAPSLKESGQYCYSLYFNTIRDAYKGVEREKRKERKNGSNHKLKNVVFKLRELFYRNRVMQQNELSHVKRLCRKRQEGTFTPLKQYKRARSIAQRIVDDRGISLYEMTSKENRNNILYQNEGMSKKAIASFLGCGLTTAHKIVRTVCNKKQIERHFSFTPTGIKATKNDFTHAYFDRYADQNDWGGFLRPLKRNDKIELFVQGSNRYEIKKMNFLFYAM